MAAPFENLLERLNKRREDFKEQKKEPSILSRGGVAHTRELDRILNLYSYRWQDDPDLPALGTFLEKLHAKPPQTACRRKCGHLKIDRDCPECIRASVSCSCGGSGEMHLRPTQIAALQAIHDFGGLFGPIRVGGGKTLISFLAGPVCGAERVLLVIPAKLKKKTLREFAFLRRHWEGPKRLHIMTYELLARDRGIAELKAFRPDLIASDESHKLKNPGAACTKRIRRYLTEDNPEAGYIDMSGTTTKRSIMEYAHRLHWAVPDGLQAIPRKFNEIKDWADAIDERPSSVGRLLPGALFQLFSDTEIEEASKDQRKTTAVRLTRQAYGRRLLTAPGVVGTEDQFDGAMSLSITGQEFEPGEQVIQAFQGLRENWALPDGQPIDMPATLWRHARELIQGFYYKWDPPPPKEWLFARKEWAAIVRECLKRYRDIDSPLGVTREVDKGRIPWAEEALRKWREIKGIYTPNTVAEWIDDSCLRWVEKWAKDNRGIIWVGERAFGERLDQELGIPYYRSKGMCRGKMIEDETGTCAASVLANSEGRNLQQFSKNLIVSCPPGALIWEQMLGRTHRDGQLADEIENQVLLGCFEQWDVFRRAMREAEYIERTLNQSQKLNFADVTIQEEAEIAALHAAGDPLWDKKNADFFGDRDTYTTAELRASSLTIKKRAEIRRGLT